MGCEPILPIKWSVSIDTMVNFDGDGTCKQAFNTWMSLPNKYKMGVDALYIPQEFEILTYHIVLFKILILMCSKKIHKLFHNNVIFNSIQVLNMKERRTLTDKMI